MWDDHKSVVYRHFYVNVLDSVLGKCPLKMNSFAILVPVVKKKRNSLPFLVPVAKKERVPVLLHLFYDLSGC